MNEYEIAGIESIGRGVLINDGKQLIFGAKGGKSTYLPGGHIEFGETGRVALVREMKEELGVDASVGVFLGAHENSFLQHGKPHAEINLIYELKLADGLDAGSLRSQEDWIEFIWQDLDDLDSVNLLPEAFRRLSDWPEVRFEC